MLVESGPVSANALVKQGVLFPAWFRLSEKAAVQLDETHGFTLKPRIRPGEVVIAAFGAVPNHIYLNRIIEKSVNEGDVIERGATPQRSWIIMSADAPVLIPPVEHDLD